MKPCCLIAIAIILSGPSDVYSHPANQDGVFLNRYNVDVDNIIQSKRLLINYANCILDKGPCTTEGRELKNQIPEAIKTSCGQCSEEEKRQVGKIFAHLLQYHRNIWNDIMEKYDSDGEFRKKYELGDDDDYEEDD